MTPKEAQQIGSKIREQRSEKALTQPALAERAGISLPFLKRVELGQATLSAPLLGRIAKTLDVSADYFLDHVETDQQLADRLWKANNLGRQFSSGAKFDFAAKKAVLRSLGLWKRE
jgi:transcriptional regulator with XRE-family HTH domain